MARTQKNKATAYHLGQLRAKLAKLKRELIAPSSGGGGGGVGGGGDTSPTGYLGPPPVPMSSPPTTPAAAPSKPTPVAPSAGTTPAGMPMGGGMMPMMPGAMGAGAGGDGNKDKPDEKRVAAPGVPNGQPVKGRMTAPPNVPVTKSVEGKPVPVSTTKRIVDKSDADAAKDK